MTYLGEWYDKAFADWGVAGFQSVAYPDAHERYIGNIKDMVDKKNWNPALLTGLTSWSYDIAQAAPDAEQYWATIATNEPAQINSLGYNPAQLPNYEKHLNWLSTVTDAAGSYVDVLKEYSPTNVIKETISGTVDDLDPRKSWIPWAIGGGALTFLYLIFRR